jgi:hypothetical protein
MIYSSKALEIGENSIHRKQEIMIQKGKVPRPLNLCVHDIVPKWVSVPHQCTHHKNKLPKINQKQKKTLTLGNYKQGCLGAAAL